MFKEQDYNALWLNMDVLHVHVPHSVQGNQL